MITRVSNPIERRSSLSGSGRRDAGLTFIEVVVSIAMLSVLSAALMGSLSFMETASARERHRLNATEVAHRVIAQDLDNTDEPVIKENRPIQQGDSVYRWSLDEEVLVQEDTGARNRGRRVGKKAETLTAEEQLPAMLNRITVRVYLDDEDQPRTDLDTSRPMAEMVRIFNPISGRPEEEVLRRLLKLVEQAQREQDERQKKGAGTPQKGPGHP